MNIVEVRRRHQELRPRRSRRRSGPRHRPRRSQGRTAGDHRPVRLRQEHAADACSARSKRRPPARSCSKASTTPASATMIARCSAAAASASSSRPSICSPRSPLLENVALPLELDGVPEAEARERAAEHARPGRSRRPPGPSAQHDVRRPAATRRRRPRLGDQARAGARRRADRQPRQRRQRASDDACSATWSTSKIKPW